MVIRLRKRKTPLADWEYPVLILAEVVPDTARGPGWAFVGTPVVLEYWDENYGGGTAAEVVD